MRTTGLAIVLFATAAGAQDSLTKTQLVYEPPVPARSILRLQEKLQLSEAQISRLRALEATQVGSLSRATAAFLRAEADLLDAGRRDDIVLYRAALEKRSKVAIDAEITRLQSEKESRAVLTLDQRATLGTLGEPQELGGVPNEVAVWQTIVAPPPLTRAVHVAPVLDSTEVRLAVTPIYADLYVDDVKIGSGRRFVKLAVGMHAILYHAAGCTDVTLAISVTKGPPIVLPLQTLTCSSFELFSVLGTWS